MPLLVLIVVALAAGFAAARLSRPVLSRPLSQVAIAIGIGGAVVVGVLAVIVGETHLVSGLDQSVADWAYRNNTSFTHRCLGLVTDLGETWAVLLVGLAVALVDLVRRRSPWALPLLFVVIAGDKFLTVTLKQIVDRARPTLEPVAATLGPSFPSGHSSTAAASWAAFAFVAAFWWGRRSWPALVGGVVAVAVAVALSRVFLDVHWLTDVIGGLALGWSWFAVCAVGFGGLLGRGRQS
ncbi:MAG: phosphatase PAP2 family protein [Actinobacteria bacterium]|nr:phosphatase PAP2 family protein [Actinomycetota bacterium]